MITALCPTYGRFELLRDAVACFLLQTYRPRRMLILNDAPKPLKLTGGDGPLRLPGCTIEVWNNPERYETLGHKRQALLTGSDSKYVAHWDDDDWYLPWHLSQCVDALQDSAAQCIKPRGAWWVLGDRGSVMVKGPKHNVFEGQMAFQRRAAIDLGGYTLKDSGQAKDLMGRFKKQGTFKRFEPGLISYCYRWSHGGSHISAAGDGEPWAEKQTDYGGGQPIVPEPDDPRRWAQDRMQSPWRQLVDAVGDDECAHDLGLYER